MLVFEGATEGSAHCTVLISLAGGDVLIPLEVYGGTAGAGHRYPQGEAKDHGRKGKQAPQLRAGGDNHRLCTCNLWIEITLEGLRDLLPLPVAEVLELDGRAATLSGPVEGVGCVSAPPLLGFTACVGKFLGKKVF